MSNGGVLRKWRKQETRVCEVELPEPKECPVCGARGLHGCTGNPDTPNVVYVGKRAAAKHGRRRTRTGAGMTDTQTDINPVVQEPYYVDGEQVMWRKFTDMDEVFVEARERGDAFKIAETLNHLHAQADRIRSEEREVREAAARVMELHSAGVLTIDADPMSDAGHEGSSALIRLAAALTKTERTEG